jgi:hypothetical protein
MLLERSINRGERAMSRDTSVFVAGIGPAEEIAQVGILPHPAHI